VQVSYVGGQWGGAIEGIVYDDQDDVSQFNSEQETDGYAVVNLNAWWEAMTDLRLAVGLDNLLDEDGEDHLGGYNRVRGNEDLAVGARMPAYGRNVFLRLDYDF
jgi:iron complex outermembrane receptor protein